MPVAAAVSGGFFAISQVYRCDLIGCGDTLGRLAAHFTRRYRTLDRSVSTLLFFTLRPRTYPVDGDDRRWSVTRCALCPAR